MVVFTGIAVATVATGGTAAAAGATLGSSLGTGASVVGTGSALGAAVGSATAAGAIAGTVAAGSAAGAGAGAVAGGAAAAGVGASGIGGSAIVAGISAGPVGWICIGAKEDDSKVTYDCWKPVIHDRTEEPSDGMMLENMIRHPNVANVSITPGTNEELPYIVIENIWNEKFEIQYFILCDSNRLVGHAKAL